MKIFADSSFLIALYDITDQYYKIAGDIFNTIKKEDPQVVITDYIYDETMTFLLSTHKHHGFLRAQAFDKDVFEEKFCDFIFITDNFFRKARDIFDRYNTDKFWSFTDCTSFAVMEDYGIRNVLTFDKNFKEMGFKIVKSKN